MSFRYLVKEMYKKRIFHCLSVTFIHFSLLSVRKIFKIILVLLNLKSKIGCYILPQYRYNMKNIKTNKQTVPEWTEWMNYKDSFLSLSDTLLLHGYFAAVHIQRLSV